MRLLVGLFLLAAAFTAQAQRLTDIDVKPGYLLVDCKSNETDNIGTLGLLVNKISSTQTEDTISLTVNSSLFVCSIALDGSKKLSWKTANPFKGFAVQYYNFQTNSIQKRKVFIDPSKNFNRMTLTVMSYSQNNKLSAFEANMHEDINDTFTGTLQLKKSKLLSASDIADLQSGKTVQKKVELYHDSNFTTVVNNEEIQFGDENRSGQNLFLQFKKEGQVIRLVKISN
jgi:hypothetical protein